MDAGQSWRRFVWAKAWADLLPTLPIEVVRLRVKRAADLGLAYKTYAGIRASTGHDLVGFMFSSNALRVLRRGDDLPAGVVEKLNNLRDARRVGVMHGGACHDLPPLDATHAAPQFNQSWSAMRDRIAAIIRADGRPSERYLMVGETAFEREWAEAGRMAGYISGQHFFDGTPR